jgi:tetratricopeptide (TPR) repeat protein
MLGCFDAAAKEAKIALDIMPHNAEALKYMADYYFDKKDYPEAYKYTRNCLIYTQGHVQMRTRLALIYHYLNDDEKALKVIDSIIKTQAKYAEGYYIKALIIKEKNKKEAKKLFTEAVKLSSKEPKYHIALGDLLKEEGAAASARKEWEAAFKYDSANESLKKKLGITG